MDRNQKATEVESLKARFAKAELVILAEYKGIKVDSFNKLRRSLEAKNSTLKVVKNRLAKLALKETPMSALDAHFKGTTAVAITEGDPSAPAKVFSDFIKDNEAIKLKAAFMGGKLLTTADIETLAKLPSKEELLSRLMGSMLAPAQNMVNVLAQIPRQVVNVLAAIRDQKEKA